MIHAVTNVIVRTRRYVYDGHIIVTSTRYPPKMLKLRWASTTALSFAFLALAACSASASPLRQEAPAETAEVTEVEQPTETDSAPLAQFAVEPVTTEPVQADAPAPADSVPIALYKGIPTGQTEGGFYVLGETTAPIALTDYSDFL